MSSKGGFRLNHTDNKLELADIVHLHEIGDCPRCVTLRAQIEVYKKVIADIKRMMQI